MPVWHASVAVVDVLRRRAVPLVMLGATRVARLRAQCARALGPAGEQPGLSEVGQFAVHLRRKLTEADLARISQDWLALPAIDRGSL